MRWNQNASRAVWGVALLSFAGSPVVLFADDPPKKADDPLRSQLDDDLFGDLKPSGKPVEKKPASEKLPEKFAPEKVVPETKPTDQGKPPIRIGGDADLRRSLDDRGEDFGAERPMNPLLEIGERMESVRKRLAAGDASRETQDEEQRIIDQIGKLMEQAQQQKKKQPNSSSSKNSPKPQPKPGDMTPKPGPDGEGDPSTTSKKPAEDSTERVGAVKSDASAAGAREVLVKKAWGHLPPKLREQLINTPLDRFLPEYEQLIEDYFRRLAEERGERP